MTVRVESARLDEGILALKLNSRELTAGSATVEVRNTFSAGSRVTIAGICTFFFKNPETEEYRGEKEVVDLRYAAVPSDSVLVFRATTRGCVSAFRAEVSVSSEAAPRIIAEPDVPGKCIRCAPTKLDRPEAGERARIGGYAG